jgi:hypothetical protein
MNIRELVLDRPDKDGWERTISDDIGGRVTTDKRTIALLIGNDHQCCESWGFTISQDDPMWFIGAELVRVDVVDHALNVTNYEATASDDDEEDDDEESQIMFVNFVTTRGVFQMTVYNEHNGYYSHAAKLVSRYRDGSTVVQAEAGL